jgi:hypothetical protein
MASLEERLAALEGLPKALNEERAARVALEDSLQELEVTVNTHQQEVLSIHAALQVKASLVLFCFVLHPTKIQKGSRRCNRRSERGLVSSSGRRPRSQHAPHEHAHSARRSPSAICRRGRIRLKRKERIKETAKRE